MLHSKTGSFQQLYFLNHLIKLDKQWKTDREFEVTFDVMAST